MITFVWEMLLIIVAGMVVAGIVMAIDVCLEEYYQHRADKQREKRNG